jgi:hypothetical protein
MNVPASAGILAFLGAALLIAGCPNPSGTTPGTPPPSSDKAITSFSILSPAAAGGIAGPSIGVSLPYQTALGSLVATFTTTGISVKVGSVDQVSGTTANDFTNPVTYTVTAADGSTTQYVVTVADRTPAIAMVSGDGQTGVAGLALSSPLVVQVMDQTTPIPGITVSWAASGDGSVTAGTSVTNSKGQAQMNATLGQTGGGYTYTATAKGMTGSAAFTATGATTIAAGSGTPQGGAASTTLPNPLVAKVTDNAGNPVAGITVSWAVSSGSGSLGASSSVTDSSGLAQVTATLGTSASTYTASVSGIKTTASFTGAVANGVVVSSGSGQTGTAGTALSAPLVVRVVLSGAALVPIPGAVVHWAVTAGGGSVSAATSVSDSNGNAQITATLGPSVKTTNTYTATVTGLPNDIFTATSN